MLSVQRTKIDAIDRELVRLLEARMQVVEEVARIKREHRLPVLDVAREAQVIERVTGYLEDSRYADMVAELYTHLMRLSKEHQRQQM
ncbi:chorismate mutase [Aerococcaceae bacterium NML191292]|nr:chorismate mutase [Aerococcaceae bacterium NML210727]MCW6653981.1 chorismate mutase [Aerococcaceae bacterium NML201296]MCW6659309.1 chorismate mutase [Aerococcaceae bacterium NML191292]MCW6660884.1 chorismate mutase [Aerococcaceae bacterium NML201209]MCW6662989.1 chorismate mutase [Aerococcaceae bacterium NML190073]MCW6666514.1 chorismate mutase [Aerococcaceae bacterium NML190938]MCW6674781.1 chorismate mutase [Aerococcaceae bacterium NML171108]MCW6676365.1 chorismate mutase [Aerococcacea